MYCKSCEQDKSVDEFPRNRSKPSGRGFYCNECMYERTKKWRSENKGKLAKIQHNRYVRIRNAEPNNQI